MMWRTRCTVIGLATVLAATSASTAAASTAAGAQPGAQPGAHQPASPAASPGVVTLITGDRVEIAGASVGRFAASIRPGSGRERITFHTLEVDGGLRVLPSDAVPYLAAGVLDPDLFDVTELLRDGYDDRSTPSVPLIVRYQDVRGAGSRVLTGAASTTPLGSIGGAAVRAGKAGVGQLWRSVTGTAGPAARSAFGAGVARIWLDGRVRASLDHTVPQVGAPAAWAAGHDGTGVAVAVLDTGVDAAHPDLAGKVRASENFTDSPTVGDAVGHGTHVAATVAGTGAASGGARKGVAPGADLFIGKVLNDSGYGFDSWIIAGMEWSVRSGADVVNLSLGGGPSDGTDPMSQALNRLTAEHGTLFVVAAGNDGAAYTVGTPGAADAALTVGAVDRADVLAPFSSRGPRMGDNAPKPDITAPGVAVVAARASGTTIGRPLDANYTALSGTSMATPHVAGAAAILAQAHPDWKGDRIRDALASTARPHPDLTVFEQGGGRLDVARAATQRVHATGVLDLGRHKDPESPVAAVERPVAYTNTGGAPVTLDLAVNATNIDRRVVEDDAVTLASDRVTVPAGATVEVALRLDPAKLDRGRTAGWVTATGPGGVVMRTRLATTLSGPKRTVTFSAVDRSGAPVTVPVLALHGEHRESDTVAWLPQGQVVRIEVEEGFYLLHALIEDGAPLDEQATLITNPELDVTRDVHVVLDARRGTPVRIETPRPAEQQTVFSYYVNRVMGNGRSVSHGVMHFSTVHQLNVTPTRQVSAGRYEFASRWQLVAPMVTAEVSGVSGPLDGNLLHQSPAYSGRRSYRLVYAGTGTPEELAAAGVGGAAALMLSSDTIPEEEQAAEAAKAGAAVALLVRPADWSAWTVWRPVGDRLPIPAMVVANDDGQRMIAAARGGRASLDLTLVVSSPYLYDVFHVETGRVPDRIVHRVTRSNTARFDVRYGENGGFGWAKEQRFAWRPWQTFSWNDSQRFVATPKVREEWVSAGDSVWQHRVQHRYTFDDMNPLSGGMTHAPRSFAAGHGGTVRWFTPVVRPAAPVGVPSLVSSRTGDVLSLRVPEFVDAGAGHYSFALDSPDEDTVQARVWRDGVLVGDLPNARQDVLTTGAPAAYRLALTTGRVSEEWQWATRTETVWDFRSGRPAGGATQLLPLLQIDYSVPGDLSGLVTGHHPHLLGLALRHQDGLATPSGTRVRVEVSFDEGGRWSPVTVVGYGTRYVAVIPRGTGTVSLRVSAQDARGNAVQQTVIRAYGLA